MKVILGATSFDRDKYAQEMLRSKRSAQHKRGDLPLYGVAAQVAKYFHVCDDCGGGYWDGDEYGGPHPRCKGTRGAAGF